MRVVKGCVELPFRVYEAYENPEELKPAIDSLAEMLRAFKKEKKLRTLTFCCRGSSGMFLATALAMLIPKSKIFFVRKEEPSHSTRKFIGSRKPANPIFVDDFIDTGNTFAEVCKHVKPIAVALLIQQSSTNWILEDKVDVAFIAGKRVF